ncbi:MAG: cytochrome c oxidase subunit II [Vicinamibacteria bacterium]|nr:cytochrome c oxidase subunit II [Vicinamibacteria bacterium]
MGSSFPPLLPPQASTVAVEVDALYALLVSITAFFTLLVVGLFLYFGLKYARKSESERPIQVHPPAWLEIAWSVVPLLICLVLFVWGVQLYFKIYTPPKDAITIHVVGKRWMWKVQHMSGAREINELHVPVGVPVRLLITSEDVIHAVSIPAFRIKRDAIPGTMTTTWFNATKVGEYHLFCAEYCGANHSKMGGTVYVMEKDAYQRWLAGPNAGQPPAVQGARLFEEMNCISCHRNGSNQRGPVLEGLYGKTVALKGGGTTTADDAYIRESITNPTAKIVDGFEPLMPVYLSQLSEEQVNALLAYVRDTLGKAERPKDAPAAGTTPLGSPTTSASPKASESKGR